ncbi:MFS transporter [Demequina sp. NBRC 110054]|uniref:MFS transporter n=1 Tax=Demequina sp. NBRC 110054 TaxID=1570343 RepID=UPI00135660BF|nr:MFS transporter [Demequina sp. NBRC 110054]
MFSRYRDILALPGASAFFWWGLFSRLQIGMTALATFLLVQIEYGSYATAGLVVGVLAIGAAIVNPQISKLVDEYGQSRVLRIGFAVAVAARLAFVVAALLHAPTWVLLVILPFFSGAGAQSTLTRARWTHIVPDKHALNSAFSLESSMEETLFIAGPALSTILATQVASWLPSVVAAASLLIGGYVFLALKETEPPAKRGDAGTSALASVPMIDGSLPRIGYHVPQRKVQRYRRPLRGHLLVTTPALILTSFVFATQGALFASADAATVAFAEELGLKGWSGPVLAVFALGSLVGGLLYGSRVWSRTLASRLLWGVTASGIGAITFHYAGSLAWLAILMFLTGLAIAPTMAVGDGVVHALVPRTRVTEGMAWTRVGLDLGVALGAWLTGLAIDSYGAHAGFTVTAWSGALGIALMLGGWRYLRRKKAYEETVSRAPAVA